MQKIRRIVDDSKFLNINTTVETKQTVA